MSSPADPHQELSSTYFVQDKGNRDEFARLQIADQMDASAFHAQVDSCA